VFGKRPCAQRCYECSLIPCRQVFATACFAAYVTEIYLGVGKHVAVITSDKHRYKLLLKFRLVHMTTVSVGIVLVKMSVCLFLLRLMTRRAQTWFLWGIICFLVPFVLASLSTLVCRFRHSTEENESLVYKPTGLSV
jgi:uncharacterized membrane protein YeiB